VPHDVPVYPDAGHSFMSPKPSLLAPLVKLVRLDFRPESAAGAWQRTFTFFGEYLQ
jgi:carboxymethylenebutenolidase